MPKIILLFITLTITACGHQQPSSLTVLEDTNAKTKTILTPEEEHEARSQIDLEKQKSLSKDLKDFTYGDIQCENMNCPESVGGLFIKTALSHGRFLYNNCSGTLIDSTHFLTNKHCLTDDLQEKNADCSGRVKIILPETKNNKKISVGCKKVISITTNDLDVATIPDWAVLKLSEPVDRLTPDKISKAISTKEKIYLHPVYWDNPFKAEVGIIKTVTCKLRQSASPTSDVAQLDFEKCDKKLIQGNSGTGVFSASKNIIGVMSHIITSSATHSGRGTNMTFIK